MDVALGLAAGEATKEIDGDLTGFTVTKDDGSKKKTLKNALHEMINLPREHSHTSNNRERNFTFLRCNSNTLL